MQKIIPHLWFDTEAKAAAEFHTSVFPNSKITNVTVIKDTPSGDCDMVSFELMGTPFMSISAGPYFKINASTSFMVNCDASQIDVLWNKLIDGGTALMPIDKYPFSERYGWVEDKFGVSWQLILNKPEGVDQPRIMPALLFVGDKYGKAEEASDYYLSVFKDSKRGALAKYEDGKVMFTDFKLVDLWFAAMDGPGTHNLAFNEAISFIVNCDTQEEIDYYWSKLSAVPESEQCGWCKDKFGISWQIVPSLMNTIYAENDSAKIARVTKAFLAMKKFDIAALEKAANNI